jgi:hypothetical protein
MNENKISENCYKYRNSEIPNVNSTIRSEEENVALHSIVG